MAIAATTIWEINGGSVASNAGGGGFNPANAGMLTDLTTDTNTANTSAPVCSSASYNFVAGDVGNWLYIKSGTNWTPGWYKIASVASNKATLSAAIGSASVVQITNQVTGTAHGIYGTNTAAGCATVGTPTGGTFTMDYSQNTTSIISGVADFNATGGSTNLTSVSSPFTPVMVGNLFHQTTTGVGGFGVVGWYEIASYTNATSVVLDRTPNSGTASVSTTGYVGGALSMNSTLDDDVFEVSIAGNMWFAKNNGTITMGEAISVALAGTAAAMLMLVGYNARRGDNPTGTSRPTFDAVANAMAFVTRWNLYNMIWTGTASTMMSAGVSNKVVNCKFTNTSTTNAQVALTSNSPGFIFNCEMVSLRGSAYIPVANNNPSVICCYIHDSNVGYLNSGTVTFNEVKGCIFEGNVTAALQYTAGFTGTIDVTNNTFYGSENKLGIGISMATGVTNVLALNNIFYGFATGVSHADTQSQGYDDYNDYYNNTADVTSNDKWQKGVHTLAVNPTFTNVTQITGTGASSSTNVLTDATKDFTALGVTTNDYCYLSAGTGTGIALKVYKITAVGTTTITLSSNITSSGSGSAITYQITLGHNFLPTGNI